MKNIFISDNTQEILNRINKLNPDSKPLWGKMSVGQMLAHCSVTYELVFDNIHPKPNFLKKFLLKAIVKKIVVNETPFKKNERTGTEFLVTETKNMPEEKERLMAYISKAQKLGEAHFDNKESHSFGPLSKTEWSNMFYKHLDHHLNQFGV
jgi:hypothetical protein